MSILCIVAYDGQGAVVATVDLRLLGDIVVRMQVGYGSLAYIVDATGLLIVYVCGIEVLGMVDLFDTEFVWCARVV